MEEYRFMIKQATKAPSGHNTQPWLFRSHRDCIEIHPDFSKTLKVVDPHHREMFVSLGCATENLCIAAQSKGYDCRVTISNEGMIRIQLHAKEIGEDRQMPSLLELISKRQSNRSVYNGKIIKESTLKELLSLQQENHIQIHCWEKGSEKFNKILQLILEGNAIQMNDLPFKKELKNWMRFNKQHEERFRDGLSYAVFGAPNLPQWMSRLIMNACLTPRIQNKGDRQKLESSSHLVLFTVKEDIPIEWMALGRTLERFLLNTTQAGVATAFMNQPCELHSLSEQIEQNILRGEEKEIPVVLLRMGYAKPMPYSSRKEVNEVILSD